jgi:hypothetical protein
MGTGINLFNPVDADMRVALRGGQIGMTEHLLDRPQVGAVV